MRSQVAEALLLAAAGGAAGALIAWAGVPLLVRAAPDAVAGGFGGAPIPGLANAGLDLTALLFTAGISVLAACAFGLLPALHFSGLAAGQSPASRTRRRRSPEFHARRAGGRANRFCPRPAGGIGAAHAQLLAAQQRRRRVRHEGHLHIPDRRQPPRAERPDVRLAVSVHVHGSPEGDAGRRIGRIHHHASAGRGRGHARTSPRPAILASGAEAPLVRFAGAGGAYFQTMGIELQSGRYFERVEEERGIPERDHQRGGCEGVVSWRGSARQAGPARHRDRPTRGPPSSAWSRTSWWTTSGANPRSRWCICLACHRHRRTS